MAKAEKIFSEENTDNFLCNPGEVLSTQNRELMSEGDALEFRVCRAAKMAGQSKEDSAETNASRPETTRQPIAHLWLFPRKWDFD